MNFYSQNNFSKTSALTSTIIVSFRSMKPIFKTSTENCKSIVFMKLTFFRFTLKFSWPSSLISQQFLKFRIRVFKETSLRIFSLTPWRPASVICEQFSKCRMRFFNEASVWKPSIRPFKPVSVISEQSVKFRTTEFRELSFSKPLLMILMPSSVIFLHISKLRLIDCSKLSLFRPLLRLPRLLSVITNPFGNLNVIARNELSLFIPSFRILRPLSEISQNSKLKFMDCKEPNPFRAPSRWWRSSSVICLHLEKSKLIDFKELHLIRPFIRAFNPALVTISQLWQFITSLRTFLNDFIVFPKIFKVSSQVSYLFK